MAGESQDRHIPSQWRWAYAYQNDFMSFESVAHASEESFLDWEELNTVLGYHCTPYPQWSGAPGFAINRCTFCKLQADDPVSNPLRLPSAELDRVMLAIQIFEDHSDFFQHNLTGLLRIHYGGPPEDGITHSVKLAVLNTLNAQGTQSLPTLMVERLKHWGYLCIRAREAQALIVHHGVSPSRLYYRSAMVSIEGQPTLRFQILYDPGKARCLQVAQSTWGIDICGQDDTAVDTVHDVIGTLLATWCLLPYIPGAMPRFRGVVDMLGLALHRVLSIVPVPPPPWERALHSPPSQGTRTPSRMPQRSLAPGHR